MCAVHPESTIQVVPSNAVPAAAKTESETVHAMLRRPPATAWGPNVCADTARLREGSGGEDATLAEPERGNGRWVLGFPAAF